LADDIVSFSGMLRAALGSRLAPDADGFVEMMAEDGVMEFPYAPTGLPQRLVGRQAIGDHLAAVGALISFDAIGKPRVHTTGDPAVVILEFEGRGRGVETGVPYEQRYISVIHTEGGHITRYVDYWNPLALLRATKRTSIDSAIAFDGGADG
jgi:uncharacterized protein